MKRNSPEVDTVSQSRATASGLAPAQRAVVPISTNSSGTKRAAETPITELDPEALGALPSPSVFLIHVCCRAACVFVVVTTMA